MLSTERSDFEAHLAVLFGGYQTFLTPPRVEAYWRGLQKMPLSVFVRCVDAALSESGTDKLPTVNGIWQLSKTLRARAAQPKPDAPPPYDPTHCFGQRCLLAFLANPQREQLDEPTVQRLVEVKNRIIQQMRESGATDAEVPEWRDVLLHAFESVAPLRTAPEQCVPTTRASVAGGATNCQSLKKAGLA